MQRMSVESCCCDVRFAANHLIDLGNKSALKRINELVVFEKKEDFQYVDSKVKALAKKCLFTKFAHKFVCRNVIPYVAYRS